MNFIDTHSHIYLPQFDADRDASVERAIEQGVKKIVLPNIETETIHANKSLSVKYPEVCFSLMGLHPTYVKANFHEELDAILKEFNNHDYKGVGEIGIDLYWDKTFIEEQKESFKIQVEFSLKNNLPFVIHSRDSFDEVIGVLESINSAKYQGIFHAFSGTPSEADKVIELGFKIGIGGVVTFKNSNLPEVVKHIPLKHIVLETDSPYLTPVPNRGKRNESSYIPLIADKIAQVKAVNIEEVAEITSTNASNLFAI